MKKSFKKLKLALFFVYFLIHSTLANCEILYNNIPTNLKDYNVYLDGLAIYDSGFLASQFSTNSSICTSGCTLGNITLNMFSSGLFNPTGGTHGYELQIFSDVNNTPAEQLISLNSPTSFSSESSNHIFTPTGILDLAYNTNYWVKFVATGEGESVTWSALSSASQTGLNQPSLFMWESFGFPSFFTNPKLLMTLDVTPSSVINNPIPSAIWLMGSALCCYIAASKRRKIAR